eukprot:318937_1
MQFIDLNSSDIIVLVGLIIMSFLFGRFSHLIPFKPFQTAIQNIKHQKTKRIKNTTKPGKYSSQFYKNNQLENTKLILCVRKDLKMGRGKIAAQCSHATLGVVKDIEDENDDVLLQIWRNYGQPKIVTKVDSWGEMKELNKKAQAANIATHIVCDAGKTHVPSGSYTVLAIGPAPDSLLDGITSHLKLYN